MTEESKKMYIKIRTFLTVYMPKQRGLSECTVTSYKQTINQFLLFVTETKKIRYEEVCFQDWSASMNKYLVYLKQERRVSASTRNQRLFAIRSFLKYARLSNPELMSLSMESSGIAVAKETKKTCYFSK